MAIPHDHINGDSLSDCLLSYPGQLLGGILPLCRNGLGIFYDPRRLG